jgi:hypothetical protein
LQAFAEAFLTTDCWDVATADAIAEAVAGVTIYKDATCEYLGNTVKLY